jgi:hypothetical protein
MLIEFAHWSFDVEEGAGRGRKRKGDNLDGDKTKQIQRIAEHLLKERLMCSLAACDGNAY